MGVRVGVTKGEGDLLGVEEGVGVAEGVLEEVTVGVKVHVGGTGVMEGAGDSVRRTVSEATAGRVAVGTRAYPQAS